MAHTRTEAAQTFLSLALVALLANTRSNRCSAESC
jgi:hypothetical protein